MTMQKRNPHAWLLTDLPLVPQNNFTVFSTFACGGGSSMGYKKAGYKVVGANDIDPVMQKYYETNLVPPIFIEAPIIELLKKDLPSELYSLDILDGSPPCSTFSLVGNREADWGREKFFREGQAVQVLDDLFFDFINLANKLQPKVIVAENVKGMLAGNAKGYVTAIMSKLESIGYKPQLFLLNSAFCGVPQRRERVFFCAIRKDLFRNKLTIKPDKKIVTFDEAANDCTNLHNAKYLGKETISYKYWHLTPPGSRFSSADNMVRQKQSWHGAVKIIGNQPTPTLMSGSGMYHYAEPRHLTEQEMIRVSSFPDDYNFFGKLQQYVMGMSVPPKMMQKIAESICNQWLSPV